MRKYLILVVLFIHIIPAIAQEVSFKVSAPATVIKGEQFRLSYVLRNEKGSNPNFPSEIQGFDVLYGPSITTGFSSTMINGKTTSESSESYTFVLMANQEGTFTVPSASITAGGKSYTSNSFTIKVLPPDRNTGQQSRPATTAQNIKDDDAFIRPIVTKVKVYEQEAFLITFRFYTALDARSIGKIEFPEFEGFMVEDIVLPPNVELKLEHYKGRNYRAADLKKSILFPQRSGKITIPKGKVEMIFSVPSGRRMQSLFGIQDIMTDVKRVLQTAPITIDVSPLPEVKPENFSNAVGAFTMKSEISDTDIKANDAVTITLTINGTGNLKLFRNPEVKLPTDFEIYDPKINNNFRITENGLTGTKTIEYLFIPRHQGDYTVPPIEFSYFDPKAKVYRTLTSPQYNLKVAKDPTGGSNSAVSYTNQNEVKTVQDIRFLKTGEPTYMKRDVFFFGSLTYMLWYLIPVILFASFFIYYRNLIKQNANIALMRTRKANKMARKRLKIAQTYLKDDNKEKFYEEVLRATWGYLSDKLTIPVADLNRDNIGQELTRFGASSAMTDRFIYILDTCEFARYAPSESPEAMDKLYDETVQAISDMESVIKKKK